MLMTSSQSTSVSETVGSVSVSQGGVTTISSSDFISTTGIELNFHIA